MQAGEGEAESREALVEVQARLGGGRTRAEAEGGEGRADDGAVWKGDLVMDGTRKRRWGRYQG